MNNLKATRTTRRATLASIVGLVGGLAGCTGGGGSVAGGGDTSTPTEVSAATSTPPPTQYSATTSKTSNATQSGGTDSGGAVSKWLSGTSNYDGSTVDETGSDQVTIMVGAQGNDGNFAFAPPAISISPGSKVVWEWTGEGGEHNVVEQDEAFKSELVSEKGYTFEHAFESAGTFMYYCEPHKSLGIKGAVIVQ